MRHTHHGATAAAGCCVLLPFCGSRLRRLVRVAVEGAAVLDRVCLCAACEDDEWCAAAVPVCNDWPRLRHLTYDLPLSLSLSLCVMAMRKH